MSTSLPLPLSAAERVDLTHAMHHAPKPYQRERAAALLHLANGASLAQTARTSGLAPRDPDTIAAWRTRFQAEGIAGLTMRPGRGRRPAFSPSGPRPGHRPAPRSDRAV